MDNLDLDYVKIQISFIINMDQNLKSILNIWIWIGFSKIQSMTTLSSHSFLSKRPEMVFQWLRIVRNECVE